MLRGQLYLTGTKEGCGVGECGACTCFIVEGKTVNSCLLLAASMEGESVVTVEYHNQNGELPVQEAFMDHTAITMWVLYSRTY